MPKIEYEVEFLPEDIPVRGNFTASGDDEADRRDEDAVIARLDRGDMLAWCIVEVTASLHRGGVSFKGVSRLGGCSYSSEEEFKGDAYFDDMKREAIELLARDMEEAVRRGKIAQALLDEFEKGTANIESLEKKE